MKRNNKNWMQLVRDLKIGIEDMQVLQLIARHRKAYGKTDDQLKTIANMCPNARKVAYEIKYKNSVSNQDVKDLANYLRHWAEARKQEAEKRKNRSNKIAR